MLPGIDVSKLPQGTKLLVKTHYSLYVIEKLDYGNKVLVKGGKYFTKPKEVNFPGSTWGGSCIKVNWIGYGMRMEFQLPGLRKITTSGVKNATIIAPTYQYTMNWEEEDEDEQLYREDI